MTIPRFICVIVHCVKILQYPETGKPKLQQYEKKRSIEAALSIPVIFFTLSIQFY